VLGLALLLTAETAAPSVSRPGLGVTTLAKASKAGFLLSTFEEAGLADLSVRILAVDARIDDCEIRDGRRDRSATSMALLLYREESKSRCR
jgi:hypothetical protein